MSAAYASISPFPASSSTPPGAASFSEIELVTQDPAVADPLSPSVVSVRLGGRFYTAESPVGAVLIVPAMGVPQRFYEALAIWLVSRGLHVLSFDFRGSGKSLRGKLSHESADIRVWAEVDTAAALAELQRRSPGLPINWIGHSLGGQIVPLVPGHQDVAKVITVATGSGYWRQNAAALRRKVWFLWYGLVPTLTPLLGYFPGKRLGMVGDLPKGVIRQWRRWCLNPEYLIGVEPGLRDRYADMSVPITSFSFSDDDMMSKANIDSIHGFYSGSARRMLRFDPRELGLEKIGHFGFFRKDMQGPLWEGQLLAELVTK